MSLIPRRHRYHFFDEALRDLELMSRPFPPAYWRDAGNSLTMGNTTAEVVNDAEKFAVSIDVSQFKPEELKVNLDGRVLTIQGNHELQDEQNFMKRSFVRKWTLPEDVDLAAVRSLISDDGHLSIEAPKTGVSTGRSIPIERK